MRLLLLAGRDSQSTVVESYIGLGAEPYLNNAVTEVAAGEGSVVDHYKVQREGAEAFHVGTAQATQGRDSIYHAFTFTTGAQLSRSNVYSKLLGEGSEVRLNGLYALEEAQHADHQTFVEHIAPACSSTSAVPWVATISKPGACTGRA